MNILYVSYVSSGLRKTTLSRDDLDVPLLRPVNAQLSMLYALMHEAIVDRFGYKTFVASRDLGCDYSFAMIDYHCCMLDFVEDIMHSGVPYFLIFTENRDSFPRKSEIKRQAEFINSSAGIWKMTDSIASLADSKLFMRTEMPYSTHMMDLSFENRPFLGRVEVYMKYGWGGCLETASIIEECGYVPVIRTQYNRIDSVRRKIEKSEKLKRFELVREVEIGKHPRSIHENADAIMHIDRCPIAGGAVPKAVSVSIPSIGSSHSYWQNVIQPELLCECEHDSAVKMLVSVMDSVSSGSDLTYEARDRLKSLSPKSLTYRGRLFEEIYQRVKGI